MNDATTSSPAALPQQFRMKRSELERFLAQPRVAALSWITAGGEVASTPIWFTYRDGIFLLHTSHPLPKTRAILKNDHVGLVIQDERPPYRYVSVRGRARLRQGPEEAWRLYEEQARAYYGPLTGRAYLRYGQRFRRTSQTEDVIIEVTPTKIVAMSYSDALNPATLLALRAFRMVKL